MKESEAKTKWCPYSGSRPNGIENLQDWQCCCGSACMLWEPEYDKVIKEANFSYHILASKTDIDKSVLNEYGEEWRVDALEYDPETRADGTFLYHYKAKIHKYVPVERGDCGLKSKKNGCFYPE